MSITTYLRSVLGRNLTPAEADANIANLAAGTVLRSEMGVASGVATLGASGRVPAVQIAETGTWNAQIFTTDGLTNVVVPTQAYVKCGNLVTLFLNAYNMNISSLNNNPWGISGLPYVASAVMSGVLAATTSASIYTGPVMAQISPGNSYYLLFCGPGNGGNYTNLNKAIMASTTVASLWGVLQYMAA